MLEFDSTDRKPVDYVMFGLASLGLLTAVSAVVVSSVPFAVIGAVLLLLALWRLMNARAC